MQIIKHLGETPGIENNRNMMEILPFFKDLYLKCFQDSIESTDLTLKKAGYEAFNSLLKISGDLFFSSDCIELLKLFIKDIVDGSYKIKLLSIEILESILVYDEGERVILFLFQEEAITDVLIDILESQDSWNVLFCSARNILLKMRNMLDIRYYNPELCEKIQNALDESRDLMV